MLASITFRFSPRHAIGPDVQIGTICCHSGIHHLIGSHHAGAQVFGQVFNNVVDYHAVVQH